MHTVGRRQATAAWEPFSPQVLSSWGVHTWRSTGKLADITVSAPSCPFPAGLWLWPLGTDLQTTKLEANQGAAQTSAGSSKF